MIVLTYVESVYSVIPPSAPEIIHSSSRVHFLPARGIIFAWHLYVTVQTHSWRTVMAENRDQSVKEKTDTSISLETRIAMGLFGWLALSMALMGLGIW